MLCRLSFHSHLHAAELANARAQRDSAEAALRAQREWAPAPRREHAAVDEPIPRSPNASKVKMEDPPGQLAPIAWSGTPYILWCTTPCPSRNSTYNAVEEKFPALRRCEGQWGVDRLAKQAWFNRKSYHSTTAPRNSATPLQPHCSPSRLHRRARLQRVDDKDDEDDGLMHSWESQDGGDGDDDEEEPEMSRVRR
ncbi:hypothetical protein GGX14DRAFT_394512 [Mycena pura]|uniref:Uncharacterized protein n=1 Tax=Mycena pura TaxID=153505 RepID=A0AAD6YDQ8_9AGAR|nr:hypothetical protein GGX14DRAFT_394512 [Mycena pura]